MLHHSHIEQHGITPYLNQFIKHHEVKGASKDTLKRRISAIKKLITWCDERDIQAPQQITKPILESYQRYLYHYRKPDGQPLTFNSQYVLLTPIKSFFKWLTKENYLLYNPASELELPKKTRTLPRTILSMQDIEALLSQPDLTKPQGIRDRAMLEVLYSTGMRRMELTNLTIYDIDTKRGSVWIRQGKNNKDRLIPMGEQAFNWSDNYLKNVRPLLMINRQNNTLFLTDRGEVFKRDNLSRLVKKYLNKAELNVTGSCHLLRHAMATHMLDNGADIRFIQAMLGHEDLNTTEIYTHVSIEKLKAVHQATHPRKKQN